MKELEGRACVRVCVFFKVTFQLLNQAYREDGERVSLTKKRTDESVKDQGIVDCVFLLERHGPS